MITVFIRKKQLEVPSYFFIRKLDCIYWKQNGICQSWLNALS